MASSRKSKGTALVVTFDAAGTDAAAAASAAVPPADAEGTGSGDFLTGSHTPSFATSAAGSDAVKPWKRIPAGSAEEVVVDDVSTPALTEPAYTFLSQDIAPLPDGLSCIAHVAAVGFTRMHPVSAAPGSVAAGAGDASSATVDPAAGAALLQAVRHFDCPALSAFEPRVVTVPAAMPRWTVEASSAPASASAGTVSAECAGAGTGSASEAPRCTIAACAARDALPQRQLLALTSKADDSYRQIASITKCMTLLVVLGLLDALDAQAQAAAEAGIGVGAAPQLQPAGAPVDARGGHNGLSAAGLLRTRLTVTAHAAGVTGGTVAKLSAGEVFSVWDMLHGMMLPSGNDAATALAEHYGPHCAPEAEETWEPFGRAAHYACGHWDRTHPVSRFVAEMNRAAAALGMRHTRFSNPHGLVHVRDHSTAGDVLRLIAAGMADRRFRQVVGTAKYACEALLPQAGTAASAALATGGAAQAAAALAASGASVAPVSAAGGADGASGVGVAVAVQDAEVAAPAPTVAAAAAAEAAGVAAVEAAVSGESALASAAAPSAAAADIGAAEGSELAPAASEGAATGVRKAPRPPRLVSSRTRTTQSAAASALSGAGAAPTRKIRWANSNDLLPTSAASSAVRGLVIDGIKTGITPNALACLTTHALSSERTTLALSAASTDSGAATAAATDAVAAAADCGELRAEFFCVTLGSRNKTLRFVDNSKVLQWCVEAIKSVAPMGEL
jgi:D-alanyl-D-alanine carboxypeptidase